MAYLVRFPYFVGLFLASISLLIADWDRDDGRSLAAVVVSICLSIVGIVLSLIPKWTVFVRRLESVVIFGILIIWASAATIQRILPSASNASAIFEPNTYLSALACLTLAVLLLASWFVQYIQNEDSPVTTQFVLLGSSSFMLMISCITFRDRRQIVPTLDSIFDDFNVTQIDNRTDYWNFTETPTLFPTEAPEMEIAAMRNQTICEASESLSCDRVYFGIAVGAIAAAIATATAPWKNAPLGCLLDVTLILFALYCAAVAVLTFNTGPAKVFGTIHFATWASLFLCLDILVKVMAEQVTEEKVQQAQHALQVLPTPFIVTEMDNNDFEPVEAWIGSPRPSSGSEIDGNSTSITPNRSTLSRRPMNRGPSGSILFSSVGAWRGATIRDFDGNVIPPEMAGNVTHQQQITVDQWRYGRFELWVSLLITSIVCLVVLFPLVGLANDRFLVEKLSLAASTLSVAISGLGFVANLRQADKVEFMLIFVCTGTWIIGLPMIFHTEQGSLLIVDGGVRAMSNANLFFGAWSSFLIGLLLVATWFKASASVRDWILLTALSVALAASSILFWIETAAVYYGDDDDAFTVSRACTVLDTYSCQRILFGTCLGVASGVLSIAMIVMHKAPPLAHLLVGSILLVCWCCGVALITFRTLYPRILVGLVLI